MSILSAEEVSAGARRPRSKALDSPRRCTNTLCDKPDQSPKFVLIDGTSTSGGKDWSSLSGSVLCSACYSRFKHRGTLERYDRSKQSLTGPARRCSYSGCEKPLESTHFHQIDGNSTAGGRDWSSLAGTVVCHTCYERFRKRGTLERFDFGKTSPGAPRRCSYEWCENPESSNQFFHIRGDKKTGDQDWSSLAGSILCSACYQQFKLRGTLERSVRRPLEDTARRCTYEGCEQPDQNRRFHFITADKKAGGQDWTPVKGSVLCHACYCRYKKRGTLERYHGEKHWDESGRKCSNDNCDQPHRTHKFVEIDGDTTAGGQDWSALVGCTLCHACYQRYRLRGRLDRVGDPAALKGRKSSASVSDSSASSSSASSPPAASSPVQGPVPAGGVGAKRRAEDELENLEEVGAGALLLLCNPVVMGNIMGKGEYNACASARKRGRPGGLGHGREGQSAS